LILVELFARFVVVSLLAFGGGQAALPLVERLAVNDTGWVEPSTFAAAVAFSYLTPGPVLIAATFIGYRAAGIAGAVAATLGAFVAPWVLATGAAQQAARLADHPGLRAFGTGAAPAVVGLLGVTALAMSREAFTAWPFLAICAIAFVLATLTRIHPVALLASGGLAGLLTH
jgi:chromate transporter